MNRLSHSFRARKRTDIDDHILPLINIVFLLLAFFLVAGELTKRGPVEVDPPVAETQAAKPAGTVQLHILRDGTLYADGEPVAYEGLASALVGTEGEITVVADAGADAAGILSILKSLRSLGHADTKLVTRTASP